MFEESEEADEAESPPPQPPTDATREDMGQPRDWAIGFAESPADCVQSVECLAHSLYRRKRTQHCLYCQTNSLQLQTVLVMHLSGFHRLVSKAQ